MCRKLSTVPGTHVEVNVVDRQLLSCRDVDAGDDDVDERRRLCDDRSAVGPARVRHDAGHRKHGPESGQAVRIFDLVVVDLDDADRSGSFL